MAFKIKTLLISLFALIHTSSLSANNQYSIVSLGIENGLSNNSVRSIFKDSKGLMWFGTHDGLNRYDGHEIKVYRNRIGDTSSLSHNYIYAIGEDANSKIWVGTGQGIAILNRITNRFDKLQYQTSFNGKISSISAQVNTISKLNDGTMLVGTNGSGLFVKQKDNPIALQIPILKSGVKLFDYNATSIAISKNGEVWIFIDPIGLCLYDKASKTLRVVNEQLRDAYCIVSDKDDRIWISGSTGIFIFDTKQNRLADFDGGRLDFRNSEHVLSMFLDDSNRLWTGTKGEGIKVFNTLNGKQLQLPLKEISSSQSILSIYQDKERRFWIGTSRDGVNIINPSVSVFKTVSHQVIGSTGLINNYVSSFYEETNRKVWIGTDGGGISIWDRQHNTFTNKTTKNGLSNNTISTIKQDFKGDIWIATYGGGIDRYERTNDGFRHYPCVNAGVQNENIWQLLEDKNHTLWATAFSHGTLYYLNREVDKFEVFDAKLRENLLGLYEDKTGMMWGGNESSLIKIDRGNKKYTYSRIGKPVRVIFEDSKGNFWLGTEGGGLILFDRKTGKIKQRFTTEDGLSNNAVLSILEDKGALWISTFGGLSKFDIASKKFTNFYQEDGLQSNQFLDNASLKLKSGELLFGGVKGFNIFHPDSIQMNGIVPPILITAIRIDNQELSDDKSSLIDGVKNGQVVALEIPYNQASLSIDFTALEYSLPGKIAYAYFMDGWDKNWNYVNKNHTATYTKLTEGTYKLRIKSTTTSGAWATNEIILKIKVLPPWYRSWWAYTLYLGLAVIAIFLIDRYQKRQTILKYQVEMANLKAEQEKELAENKLSFFTNISHEFRTPLTLIINPIKEFLNHRDSFVDPKELIIVYRNARRLLSLVDQLLSFRKSEIQQLKVGKFELIVFCKEIHACFVNQAQSKSINFVFQSEIESAEIYADREKLEIVLFNLIANAFKFTPSGGLIKLTVLDADSELQIAVSDTGSGISKENQEKIFDRFFQEAGSKASSGFGIGLFLVRNLIEAHRGTVSVESVLNEGSEFTVTLQKGKNHFPKELIKEEEILVPSAIQMDYELESYQATEVSNENSDQSAVLDITTDKKVILIVEDNDDIRNYLQKTFKEEYIVFEANGGEKGFELVQKHMPDIVITDVMMDEGNGLDLCTKIKSYQELSHIPIIILTSSSSSEMKLKGIEQGADDFITKPFEKEILIARVANLLKSRNTLQQYFINEITLKADDFKVSNEYKEFLERCIEITERHLDDANFGVKTLADELAMSSSLLYKKVKSISGKSTNEFIRYIRLRKAAQLFIHSDNNVNQTAMLCGFNDIRYFREQFFKVFGIRPSDYIKKYRTSLGEKHRFNKDMQ